MEEIYDANDQFDFSKLTLSKPTTMSGGNYFIKLLMRDMPLYIQPPKCKTKQGIIKGGKRLYSDLMFTNENENFIRWMENLESHCQRTIYNHKSDWFDGEMEMDDIENYFTSPLKLYKSGKFYSIRTNITTTLGKTTLKIYDEHEHEIEQDEIDDKTLVMTILEIQGIKCSAKSFQIEIELKQMMVIQPVNLFEKCIIRSGPKDELSFTRSMDLPDNSSVNSSVNLPNNLPINLAVNLDNKQLDVEVDIPIETSNDLVVNSSNDLHINIPLDEQVSREETEETEEPDLHEVEFHLEELTEVDSVHIKDRNDVYYKMYRDARQKAKEARNIALSSYLEAKRIKNTYLLVDIKDSDSEDEEEIESMDA